MTWNPDAPHCWEERRYVGSDGTDGGGHSSCMTELNPDGSCPHADEHHRAWIDSGLSQNDWAASVVAARDAENAALMGMTPEQWRTHRSLMEQGTTKVPRS